MRDGACFCALSGCQKLRSRRLSSPLTPLLPPPPPARPADSFRKDALAIIAAAPPKRQLLALSATYAPATLQQLRDLMGGRQQEVLLCCDDTSLMAVRQCYRMLPPAAGSGEAAAMQQQQQPGPEGGFGPHLEARLAALLRLLSAVSFQQAVVFCKYRAGALPALRCAWLCRPALAGPRSCCSRPAGAGGCSARAGLGAFGAAPCTAMGALARRSATSAGQRAVSHSPAPPARLPCRCGRDCGAPGSGWLPRGPPVGAAQPASAHRGAQRAARLPVGAVLLLRRGGPGVRPCPLLCALCQASGGCAARRREGTPQRPRCLGARLPHPTLPPPVGALRTPPADAILTPPPLPALAPGCAWL